MKRLTEGWFEFGGVRCESMGVRMMDIPKRTLPAKQGRKLEIDGRSGYLWQRMRRAYKPIPINVECSTMDGFSADALGEWLAEGGLLRFSDEPDRVYRARVTDEFLRSSMFFGFDRQVFTIPFLCQPFRYIYPAAEPETLTGAKIISNPGTAYSEPRITIRGSGDMVVNIGEYMIGVTGAGVIVDSETMDCYELDGVTLANGRVTMDEYPMIPPGGAVISWAGGVTSVTIEGRWRSV